MASVNGKKTHSIDCDPLRRVEIYVTFAGHRIEVAKVTERINANAQQQRSKFQS